MKKVEVTDRVFRLIDKLQSDEGYDEVMESLCEAFASATEQMFHAEAYDSHGFHTLYTLAQYRSLLVEIAKSKTT